MRRAASKKTFFQRTIANWARSHHRTFCFVKKNVCPVCSVERGGKSDETGDPNGDDDNCSLFAHDRRTRGGLLRWGCLILFVSGFNGSVTVQLHGAGLFYFAISLIYEKVQFRVKQKVKDTQISPSFCSNSAN